MNKQTKQRHPGKCETLIRGLCRCGVWRHKSRINAGAFSGMTILFLILMLSPPVFAGSASKVQEQQFFESLSDVPLMPGLYELLDESVVFDKPGGRIIESAAASDERTGAEIRQYYDQALPQMGWARVGPDAFTRQDEELTLNVENRDGYSVVRFMVSPR